MKLPLRIAILQADTPLPSVQAKHGNYGNVFKVLLEDAADALGHAGLSSKEGLELSFWHVVDHEDVYPELDTIDAVLITGSRHNSFDSTPWILKLVDYTKRVLANGRVRAIGVCFGHQIIGRALGTPVGRSSGGWEVSVVPIDLTAEGKAVFKQEQLSLYQMHQDAIDGLPEGTISLASTPKCANHAMYQRGRFISVQGHPEFTWDIVTEILDARQAIFPPGVYEDGVQRLRDHDDGVLVAQAFLRFLLDD